MTFHLMCVYITCMLSSVWIAEWPPFGKELLTRLAVCSLCILTICSFSYFGFEGWVWALISSVSGLWMLLSVGF